MCSCMCSTGVYEVGVHIADVSYFVEAGTALDEVAGQRATSVYLVQRVSSCMYVYGFHCALGDFLF